MKGVRNHVRKVLKYDICINPLFNVDHDNNYFIYLIIYWVHGYRTMLGACQEFLNMDM